MAIDEDTRSEIDREMREKARYSARLSDHPDPRDPDWPGDGDGDGDGPNSMRTAQGPRI